MNSEIRFAKYHEINWVNEQYDKVKFKHSNFYNEIIAIAECNNVKCGIGRLVKIDNFNLELGGIYVLEEYRSHKIATKIIDFLLNHVDAKNNIYCIPFKNLSSFYKKFGFENVTSFDLIPKEILNKYNWCKETYSQEVDFLIKPKKNKITKFNE